MAAFALAAATLSSPASSDETPSYLITTAGALTEQYTKIHKGAALNVGIGIGVRIPQVDRLAMEAIFTGSAVPRPANDPGPSDNVNSRTQALFAAYRTRTTPYIKGRLGVGRESRFIEGGERETRAATLAGGIGLGMAIPGGALEVEQSFFNSEAWFLALSYSYDLR